MATSAKMPNLLRRSAVAPGSSGHRRPTVVVAAQQGPQQGWFESIERALNLSPTPAQPKPLWAQLFKQPGQQTMIRNAYEQGFQQGMRQATKQAPKPLATGPGALLEDSNLTKQVIALGASGAVLGPLLDGLHSSHNVLHYNNPSHLTIDAIGFDLETCWWVPVLFGIAGATIGTALPLLDRWRAEAATGNPNVPLKYPPSWPAVLVAISLFTFQYYLSAELELPIMGLSLFNEIPVLDLLLAFYAIVFWAVFDATGTGLLVAGSTAIIGPIVELFLINVGGAYEYMHPPIDGAGIPSWIPWVYFCGAVAVGALGRRVNAQLQE